MPSHAGRWNSKRIQSVRKLFDSYNDIVFVPIYKKDHANVCIYGIDNGLPLLGPLQIARAGLVINAQSKNTVNDEKNGIFSLSAYDEDMFYGMSAILSSLGYSVYLPKLVKRIPEQGKWFPVLNSISFKEFKPDVSFSEEKIVSVNNECVLNFCLKRKQPEFAF